MMINLHEILPFVADEEILIQNALTKYGN